MRSERLPGKVLMPAAGKPLLCHMIERLRKSRFLEDIVVATTRDDADQPIVDLCLGESIPCFRGHADDVLDRFYSCAREFQMTHIALLGADNPLIDADVCDQVLGVYLERASELDYVSNHHPPTYPDGQDVEVLPFPTLEKAWQEARKPFQREHATPFIWDQPELFRCHNVVMQPDLHRERWTLDYPEDYEFIREVFESLYPHNPWFSMQDVLAMLDARPALREVNANRASYTWHAMHADELRTIPKK
jgi:spore coat polysaccharide biosynthesis protein SpsF